MPTRKKHKPPQWARLKRVYGITQARYESMLRGQRGLCYICHRDPRTFYGKKRHNLCVDHDHYTGEIRGLLCQNCNSMISRWLRDDVDMAKRVVRYFLRKRNYGKVPE
jgi:hypothetical protein